MVRFTVPVLDGLAYLDVEAGVFEFAVRVIFGGEVLPGRGPRRLQVHAMKRLLIDLAKLYKVCLVLEDAPLIEAMDPDVFSLADLLLVKP